MNSDQIIIRHYKPEDKLFLLNLINLNTPKYFAVNEKVDFEHYLENERELYFVLIVETEIVGCGGINFEEEESIGIISWDMIHPEFHGKGLGKQLLDYRLSELNSKKSIKKIIVRTSQLTYRFYEKAGFKVVEIIPDYWAEGFDLYAMEIKN